METLTISMTIFNSYVSLPEDILRDGYCNSYYQRWLQFTSIHIDPQVHNIFVAIFSGIVNNIW